jgi:hypothetical protein
VDELATLMSEDEFDLAHESFFIERDGIFDVNNFMHDLGKLYQVASFAFALDMILKGYDDAAFNLADDGRYFEGVPFLEKYKGELPEMSDEIDDTPITPEDLIKEMQEASRNAPPVHRNTIEEGFATLPYDDYYILRDKLVDMMPDFRMRLKVNRKKNLVVLAADIHSVFDIAWYTLAKRRYATSSSSRSGPRMLSPTSWASISAQPVERICSSTRWASRARSSSGGKKPPRGWRAVYTDPPRVSPSRQRK